MSDYSKIAYDFYKRNKICTWCGKRKTNGTRTICDRCSDLRKNNREKYKKAKRNRYIQKISACYKCGSNLSSIKGLCDKCYGEVVIPEYLRGKIGKA